MLRCQLSKILVSVIIVAGLSLSVFAQEKISTEDKIIGSTCKGLFSMFLSVNDFDKLKKESIAKVKKMDDVKFNKKYTEVYPIIRDLPPGLVEKYHIRKDFTREDALRNMAMMDKNEAFRVINIIPDEFFAKKLKEYFAKNKNAQSKNFAESVNNLWNTILRKKPKDEPGKK